MMEGELGAQTGEQDDQLVGLDVGLDGLAEPRDRAELPTAASEEAPAADTSASDPAVSVVAAVAVAEPAAVGEAPSANAADQTPDHTLIPAAPALVAQPAGRVGMAPLPLTGLTVLLLVCAGLALVAAAAGLALALTAGDWGSGARAAGLASLALGVICLGATLARALRRHGRLARVGIAAVLLYSVLGGGALATANPLRLAQGHLLEGRHDWPGALRAYLLAGEDGAASSDPARVYIEWGDDLAAQGQYAAAIDRYEQAIVRYPLAQAQLRQAIAALWPVYATWLSTPSSALPYASIVQSLIGYQRSAWCVGDCQSTAAALEAQARFAYGLELAGEQQYAEAIKWLESVRTADPASPYVARAHAAAATAYYALGQAQLHGQNCPAALPTYQALASSYRDTPEGKRASTALAASVPVSGRLTGYPTAPAPTMYLSTKVYSASHFSDDYSTALDGAGNFTFAQVKPGAYNLSAAFGDGSGRYWQSAQGNNLYAVAVAPLCALNLGTYSW